MKKFPVVTAVIFAALALAVAARADDPPAPPAKVPAAAPAPAAKVPGPKVAGKNDRLDLDPTLIRGNQELPKVLYIVPWKESGPAEPAGRPVNSLIDEALAPVDREVFRRQVGYFDQLYPARGKAVGGGGASP